MRTTAILLIPTFSSSSTMKAQSQCGAPPRHEGVERMSSRYIPQVLLVSPGAKKVATAEWKTDTPPMGDISSMLVPVCIARQSCII